MQNDCQDVGSRKQDDQISKVNGKMKVYDGIRIPVKGHDRQTQAN